MATSATPETSTSARPTCCPPSTGGCWSSSHLTGSSRPPARWKEPRRRAPPGSLGRARPARGGHPGPHRRLGHPARGKATARHLTKVTYRPGDSKLRADVTISPEKFAKQPERYGAMGRVRGGPEHGKWCDFPGSGNHAARIRERSPTMSTLFPGDRHGLTPRAIPGPRRPAGWPTDQPSRRGTGEAWQRERPFPAVTELLAWWRGGLRWHWWWRTCTGRTARRWTA